MKNIIPLIFLFVSSLASGQIVNIPDVAFKNFLISCNNCVDLNNNGVLDSPIDINNDGEIQVSEAENVIEINIESTNISSLVGIESFTNLERLITYYVGNLTFNDINLANLTSLKHLEVSQCASVTAIDVSGCVNLEWFMCSQSPVTTLEVIDLLNLEFLRFGDELPLTSVQIDNCPSLTEIQFTSMSIDNGPQIDLDLTGVVNLEILNLQNNDRLENLYIKNGSNETLNLTNCVSLSYVCADDNEMDYVQTTWENINWQTPNVSSYCSFIPGGSFNTITGTSSLDLDNNGCDANDLVFPYLKLNINDGTETGTVFTTNNGEYNLYKQEGDFTITPDFENPSFFNVSPINANVNFPDANANTEIQDFCITVNGVNNDLEIVIAPTEPARPGFDAEYIITYKNKGNQTLTGELSLAFDDAFLDFVSSTEAPETQELGMLTWNYTNLLPFESRSIYVTLNVNGPMETPAINIGDELYFTVKVTPIINDASPNDNVFDYKQVVVGSYDPNDITCLQGDLVEPIEIGEYLHYIINFENTGNFTAQNVVVATEINPTMFNINSLRILNTSHDAYIKVTGNLVEFVFEGIYLNTGGHGGVLLKVQTKDVLVEDNTVTKNANIFFDYNFPIETNNAETTFSFLSISEFELDTTINLYPNPVKDIITISAKNKINSISVFDVQGKLLQTKIVDNRIIKVNMASRSKGVYFVKIKTNRGVNVKKIIRE